jgi:hypothetical protein
MMSSYKILTKTSPKAISKYNYSQAVSHWYLVEEFVKLNYLSSPKAKTNVHTVFVNVKFSSCKGFNVYFNGGSINHFTTTLRTWLASRKWSSLFLLRSARDVSFAIIAFVWSTCVKKKDESQGELQLSLGLTTNSHRLSCTLIYQLSLWTGSNFDESWWQFRSLNYK